LGLDEIFPEAWCSLPRTLDEWFPPDFGGFSKILGTLCRESYFFAPEKGVQKKSQRGERSPTSLRPKGVTRAGEWSGTICTLCQSDLAEKKTAFLSIYRWFLYTNQAFPRTVEKIFPKLAAQLLKSAFFVGLRWVPIYFQQILA